MACACEKAGEKRCAWCNEAVVNGFKDHKCQWPGGCS